MSISRYIPKTKNSRYNALLGAKQKKDNTAPASMAITPATITRLDVIEGKYNTARNELGKAEAASILSTEQKTILLKKQEMLNSHYMQVFYMHIAQGIYPAAHKALFKVDANSTALPPNSSESEITMLAKNILDGEPLLIAAGGAAIPFPTKANVKANYDLLIAKQIDQSNKKDATDKAEEAIDKLNTEADAVIKKVWDEVETYFNEEPTESLRRKSREWGLVYISTAATTPIVGFVRDAATEQPIIGATITIISSDEATTSQNRGSFELKTGTSDSQVLRIEKAGYNAKEVAITIVAGQVLEMGMIDL